MPTESPIILPDGARVDRLDRMPALSTGVRNEGYGTHKRLSSKSGGCRCAAFWLGLVAECFLT
jgi:hypothetical protein